MSQSDAHDFEEAAGTKEPGLIAELWAFLSQTKKWWMAPILVVLLLLGMLVMLSGSAMAPFIYTLF